MVASKIKRGCQFCGQDSNSYIGIYCMVADVEKPWFVQCTSCGGRTGSYSEEQDAIDAWNGEFLNKE